MQIIFCYVSKPLHFSICPTDVKVYLGVHDIYALTNGEADIYDVSKIIVHPYYQSETMILNDIALVKLQREIHFTEFVKPICLPYKGECSVEFKPHYNTLLCLGVLCRCV